MVCVFTFWLLLLINLTKASWAQRIRPKQEAEACDAPGSSDGDWTGNGSEHPVCRKPVLKLKAETPDCGCLVQSNNCHMSPA